MLTWASVKYFLFQKQEKFGWLLTLFSLGGVKPSSPVSRLPIGRRKPGEVVPCPGNWAALSQARAGFGMLNRTLLIAQPLCSSTQICQQRAAWEALPNTFTVHLTTLRNTVLSRGVSFWDRMMLTLYCWSHGIWDQRELYPSPLCSRPRFTLSPRGALLFHACRGPVPVSTVSARGNGWDCLCEETLCFSICRTEPECWQL